MRRTQSTGLDQSIVGFLRHLELEKRRSVHTLQAARRDLAWLGEMPLQHTAESLRILLNRRRAAGLAPSSLARLVSSWRGFYDYWLRQGHVAANPTAGLKAPKRPSRLPKAVSMDVLAAALLKPLEQKDIQLARAQILVELLYFTGLRVSEAVSLDWAGQGILVGRSWVCLRQKLVQVLGKGRKMRQVPVIDVLADRLAAWKQVWGEYCVQHQISNSSSVFQKPSGKPFGARDAQFDVARFGQAMQLGQHLHPHMLRHSFGSHVLQESQNLRGVQELLGHSSLSSTQIYTALDFTHLAQVYDQAFPRSKADGS